jgi:hypothetical protein
MSAGLMDLVGDHRDVVGREDDFEIVELERRRASIAPLASSRHIFSGSIRIVPWGRQSGIPRRSLP